MATRTEVAQHLALARSALHIMLQSWGTDSKMHPRKMKVAGKLAQQCERRLHQSLDGDGLPTVGDLQSARSSEIRLRRAGERARDGKQRYGGSSQRVARARRLLDRCDVLDKVLRRCEVLRAIGVLDHSDTTPCRRCRGKGVHRDGTTCVICHGSGERARNVRGAPVDA